MHKASIGTSSGIFAGLKVSPWDSEEWTAYYGRNAENLAPVPWEAGAELNDTERGAIANSIQAFQLGESSEGLHLQRSADVWAESNRDPYYPEAIRLFIKEEQRHSRELGRFMDLNGIPLIRKNWTDTLFRNVRRLAGLELSIMVLLTAEIVAQVYYVALRDSTKSTVLKAICDQILRDEEEHVRFQCERLAIIAQPHGWVRLALRYSVQRALMVAAMPIVWSGNRTAYEAGGFSFGSFVSETWLSFSRAVPRMHPKSYEPNAVYIRPGSIPPAQ